MVQIHLWAYPLYKRKFNRKKENIIQLISKTDLQVLIKHKIVKKDALRGITVTSKTKNSRGKRYYARDDLAFTAWDLQGLNPDNKDFKYWKARKNNKRRPRNS